MTVFVIVHGAWHDGDLLGPVAAYIRAARHEVHAPTILGNGPDDDKRVGLDAAISSITDYIEAHDLNEIILVGHSYGGMIITGVADRMLGRIKRLVYWNAFVPQNGESLLDLVPPPFADMFRSLADAGETGGFSLPYPIWRDVFFNDGEDVGAREAYDRLNPHPIATFDDKISLTTAPAAMEVGKSYINGLNDAAMPHSLGWHPRLSERLGIFRLIQVMDGHEACFINPKGAAEAIMMAGRD